MDKMCRSLDSLSHPSVAVAAVTEVADLVYCLF